MAHRVKYGDERTLRWQLNVDLTTATGVRVLISDEGDDTALIDRAGTIEDAANGIVSLTLDPDTDYGPGKLLAGMNAQVEVEVSPGPVTYPECGYETLSVCWDLG